MIITIDTKKKTIDYKGKCTYQESQTWFTAFNHILTRNSFKVTNDAKIIEHEKPTT